jgi:hypothetical protein
MSPWARADPRKANLKSYAQEVFATGMPAMSPTLAPLVLIAGGWSGWNWLAL